MEYVETISDKLKREYKVTIFKLELNKKIEDELLEAQPKVNISGFRKGKVPMNYLKQKYAQTLGQENVQKFNNKFIETIQKEKKFKICTLLNLDAKKYVIDQDFKFNISFEIYPEVKNFKDLEFNFTKKIVAMTPKVEEEFKCEVLKDYRKLIEIENNKYATKNGDIVEIDYNGKVDGEEFEGGAAEKYKLELGSYKFIKGFEEQLIGKKKGKKIKVSVTFPKNYQNKELSGKDAIFEVQISKIYNAEMPEINEELLKKLNIENLEEFNKSIAEEAEKDIDNLSKIQLKKDFFDSLEQADCVESEYLPESLLEQARKKVIEDLYNKNLFKKAKKKNISLENTKELEESLSKKELAEISKLTDRRVKVGVFLAQTAEDNQISVTDQEATFSIYRQVASLPEAQQRQILNYYSQNPQLLDMVKAPILEEKTFDFIVKNIDLKEEVVSRKFLADSHFETVQD